MFNVEKASRSDLESMAVYLLEEIGEIKQAYDVRLPEIKHTLVKIENELYKRDKMALEGLR